MNTDPSDTPATDQRGENGYLSWFKNDQSRYKTHSGFYASIFGNTHKENRQYLIGTMQHQHEFY